MTNEEAIERLKRGDWCTEFQTKQEANLNNAGKLTPQNAEQEHYVQILLAMMQDIPVECDFGDGDGWVDAAILYIDLGKKYRIKPTPTPLPISREIWSHLNKRWRYATMDRDGQTFWH